jgi:hypothetical protein
MVVVMVVSRNRPRMVVIAGVRDRGSDGDVIHRPSLEPLNLPGRSTTVVQAAT